MRGKGTKNFSYKPYKYKKNLCFLKKFILFEEIMANGLQIHEFFDGSNKLVVLPRQLCRYTEKLVAKALEI